jgi:hypothetical protein
MCTTIRTYPWSTRTPMFMTRITSMIMTFPGPVQIHTNTTTRTH